MKIMINCSCVHTGGSLQVATSICQLLGDFTQHSFIIVLSSELKALESDLAQFDNITHVTIYDVPKSIRILLTGRCKELDDIVSYFSVDVVLSVFGPSRWIPRVPHICGFARAHVVLTKSPFFQKMGIIDGIKTKIFYKVIERSFARSCGIIYTENELISQLLRKKLPNHKIYTITNYYHQIFDNPCLWRPYILKPFDGFTFLCITAFYPHKNLELSFPVAREIKRLKGDIKFRFVFTVTGDELNPPSDVADNFELIGKVTIDQCPNLYRQADLMFQPTLLECFSATYPEAMKMEVPVVTSDLDFARGLCGDAAEYFKADDAESAARAIIKVITNKKRQQELTENGLKQLCKYDNSIERAKKLIKLCESIYQC